MIDVDIDLVLQEQMQRALNNFLARNARDSARVTPFVWFMRAKGISVPYEKAELIWLWWSGTKEAQWLEMSETEMSDALWWFMMEFS